MSEQLPVPPSLEDQMACVRREIALRRNVYARKVEAGQMKPEDARRELDAMKAVLVSLQFLQQTLNALNMYPRWMAGEYDLPSRMADLIRRQQERASETASDAPEAPARPKTRAEGGSRVSSRKAETRSDYAEQDADELIGLRETFEAMGEDTFNELWPSVRQQMIQGYGVKHLTAAMYRHAISRLEKAASLPWEQRLPGGAPMHHVGEEVPEDEYGGFGPPPWEPPL